MLFVFKSDASADVIMFAEVARKLLAIVGKDPEDAKGIITVAQLPDAIARLNAAIEEDKARQTMQRAEKEEEEDAEAGRTGIAAPVSLAQRAWPLLDMLQLSRKESVPVVWGV